MFTIIADGGALPFDQFMEQALYHPRFGYYRRPDSSPIGPGGDFFTASQLQPAFGDLVASLVPDESVLELGPGRGEMRTAFASRAYRSVDCGDALPARWHGCVFANEFFDALPVAAGIRIGSELNELLVERKGSTYTWQIGDPLTPARRDYVARYLPDLPDRGRFEIAEQAQTWIGRISDCLIAGTVLVIDYGWTGREYLRFPEGTLMSYRRHTPSSDILANPGRQDITAHVPFPVLIDAARNHGFTVLGFETLAHTLLSVLPQNPPLLTRPREQAQLKTLLFSMGESFRTLLLRKGA